MELSVAQTRMIVVSIARWNVGDEGEVGRQICRRTAIQCSVGQQSDFKENALRNTKPMETGERIRDVF